MIPRQRVESSDLASLGYDKEMKILEVEFVSGSVYQYVNVPENVYIELLKSESKGGYFNKHIRDGYQSSKVD